MAIYGNLASMPIPDLLQWIGGSLKTGCLQIEHDQSKTRVYFKRGILIGCASDDPPKLLGQFLLFQGMIDETTLRQAMITQEKSGDLLGSILVGVGAISAEDLHRGVVAKAEETIFGLFDLSDAAFSFAEAAEPEASAMKVSLEIEDLLARGAKRLDDREQIRRAFPDARIILRRTGHKPPPIVLHDWQTRRIYMAVNGERTIEEIVLAVHGTEFLVTRCLLKLMTSGVIEIVQAPAKRSTPAEGLAEAPGTPAPAPGRAPAPETAASGSSVVPQELGKSEPSRARASIAQAPHIAAPHGDRPEERMREAAEDRAADRSLRRPHPAASTGPVPPEEPAALAHDLDRAQALLDSGAFEAALQVLNEAHRLDPSDSAVRRLMAEAEIALIRQITSEGLSPTSIPVLVESRENLAGADLTPAEDFLLNLSDGTWDTKSLTWIAPMRTIEVLTALKRLLEMGMIELRDPNWTEPPSGDRDPVSVS